MLGSQRHLSITGSPGGCSSCPGGCSWCPGSCSWCPGLFLVPRRLFLMSRRLFLVSRSGSGVQDIVLVSRGGPQLSSMHWSQPPEGMPIQIYFQWILLPHCLNKQTGLCTVHAISKSYLKAFHVHLKHFLPPPCLPSFPVLSTGIPASKGIRSAPESVKQNSWAVHLNQSVPISWISPKLTFGNDHHLLRADCTSKWRQRQAHCDSHLQDLTWKDLGTISEWKLTASWNHCEHARRGAGRETNLN